jgi:hypothetical protein
MARALDALNGTPPPNPILLDDVHRRMAVAADDVLRGLKESFDTQDGAEALLSGAEGLAQLRADIAGSPRLRPWIGAWSAAEETETNLSAAVRLFLAAAASQTILDAQRLAREAQARLDGAAGPIATAGAQVRKVEALRAASTSEEALQMLAEQTRDELVGDDILEVDRSGQHLFERITGHGGAPPGAGLTLGLLVAEVRGTTDEDRFWKVGKDAYNIITSDSSRLVAVMRSAEWLHDFRLALLRAYDASVGLTGALASARHTRHSVDALMTSAHALVEGSAKPMMAALLACAGAGNYMSARKQDAAELIRAMSALPNAPSLEGIDRTIRIAEAHDEFEVQGDMIIVTARSREYDRLSIDELVDRLLAARETIAAWVVGAYAAMAEAGIDAPAIDPTEDMGLDPERWLAFMASLVGIQDPQVELRGDRLLIHGEATLAPASIRVVGALMPSVPDSVKMISIEGPEGTHSLSGPTGALRLAASATDPEEEQHAFWIAWSKWEFAGQPLLSREQLRKVVSVSAMEAMATGDLKIAIPRLRALRLVATAVDDRELADTLSSCVRWMREVVPRQPGASKALPPDLQSWAGATVTTPFADEHS